MFSLLRPAARSFTRMGKTASQLAGRQNMAKTFARTFAEEAGAGAKPGENIAKVVFGTKFLLKWTAITGVATLVGGCGYLVVKELNPSRMSPSGLFNETFSKIRSHPELVNALGAPVKCYGHDTGAKRAGRRNFIDNFLGKKKDGENFLRVVYNVEGTRGHGLIFAETTQSMSKGQYTYVIFRNSQTGEVVAFVDNRSDEPLEMKQERIAAMLSDSNVTLYGRGDCKYTAQQVSEFGESSKYLKVIDCIKDPQTCINAGIVQHPTWVIGRKHVTGFQTLDDLDEMIGDDAHGLDAGPDVNSLHDDEKKW
eukprot:TRINITY_DN777945_c0_g1_i1.p1 TRINITY_DN777945_c0_g1~~TRINITY_DN777945_c0_g1_i1.p1  ORF type:complete len:321 (-),score=120.03 TRINITY_DN777945_c0_g1_i1:210-1136(-)